MKLSLALAALAGLTAAAPAPAQGAPLRQRTAKERAVNSRIHRPIQRIRDPSEKSADGVRPQHSQNWAGAVQHSTGITKVTGVVKVPRASGGSQRQSGAAWGGIDGDKCGQSLLQTGIDFYGDGSYDAWYEWFPVNVIFFNDFPLHVGDSIYMEVDATSTIICITKLENLSTDKKAAYTFTKAPAPLCETDADWIVEQFDDQLVGFTDVTFTKYTAVTSHGTITPASGDVIDIRVNEIVKTDCGITGDNVFCNYLGHH